MKHPKRWRTQPAARGVILLTLALTSGCPAKLDDPDAYYRARMNGDGTGGVDTPGTTCDVPALFIASCGLPGCHTPPTDAAPSSGGLDLVSSDLASRLVGVPSSTCTGQTLVSSDGTTGFLFEKLTSTHPTCGSQMPLGGMLTSSQIDCIHTWAAMVAGATDAGGTGGMDAAGMDAR